MRFYSDSNQDIDVQWYFVSPKNPQMPWSSAFTSLIYERKDTIQPSLGERYKPVPWRGGLPPKVVSVGGICGTVRQWQEGSNSSDPVPGFYPGTQIPTCCNPPPATVFGGIAIGGIFSGPVPFFPCADQPNYHVPMSLVGKYVGQGSPPCTPWFGNGSQFDLPMVYAQNANWTTLLYNYSGPLNCGFFSCQVLCDPTPFALLTNTDDFHVCSESGVPPFLTCLPGGELQSVQISPMEVVWQIESGVSAGWQWSLVPTTDSTLYVTGPCPQGWAALRTITISGGGLSGSFKTLPAYNQGGYVWTTTGVMGCAGKIVSLFITSGNAGNTPFFQLQTTGSTCIPEGIVFASSVNCDLPSVVFNLAGGITVVLT